ncbi:hypothetical protein [Kamptonema formosum]|uniref:hypothetical protein n=1 Tax=Kamptonema formosum TaxID=331992 RepID=UPI0003465AD0|nr:hypothetical protein [Oscillatoria sp. PCC 10802]
MRYLPGGRSQPALFGRAGLLRRQRLRRFIWLQSVSKTGSSKRELPASYTGEFCDLPAIAEKNHHHSSVAGKD